MLQHKLKVVVDPFFGKILTKLLSIPKQPTNSDTPPGNFEMLSRLNELDLCVLFLPEQWSRSGCHSVKKIRTSPACLGVRALQSCQGGVTIRGLLG